VYLADLFAAGRWMTLAREWKAKRLQRTWRNAYTFVARPLLPREVLDGAAILRKGKRLRGDIEPALPGWINPEFAQRHDLPELTRSPVVRRAGESASARETQWHLRTPWVPALLSCLSDMGLQSGVEIRSPLYDRRVIEFAATRPRDERSAGGETKRLLRAAMRGLLPENVLAPRKSRTGMTTGYFARSMHSGLASLLLSSFEVEGKLQPGMLAELGVIDFKKFWASAGRYLRGTDTSTGVDLLMTLQTELWLRAHGGYAAPSAPTPAAHAVAVAE
jgi:asparagine synthase (glutamine-hydrolysing)